MLLAQYFNIHLRRLNEQHSSRDVRIPSLAIHILNNFTVRKIKDDCGEYRELIVPQNIAYISFLRAFGNNLDVHRNFTDGSKFKLINNRFMIQFNESLQIC